MRTKTILLIIILLAALVFFFSQRYDIQSSRGTDGTYRVVMVDLKSGKIYSIMGN